MSVENVNDSFVCWDQFEATADEKSRINVPQALRGILPSKFVIARAPDRGLVIYTESAWSQVEERLSQPDQNEHMLFLRRFLGGRSVVAIDTQNRLTIPLHLRQYADIDVHTAVVFLGVGDRIEIWKAEIWKEVTKDFKAERFITSAVSVGLMQPNPTPA